MLGRAEKGGGGRRKRRTDGHLLLSTPKTDFFPMPHHDIHQGHSRYLPTSASRAVLFHELGNASAEKKDSRTCRLFTKARVAIHFRLQDRPANSFPTIAQRQSCSESNTLGGKGLRGLHNTFSKYMYSYRTPQQCIRNH